MRTTTRRAGNNTKCEAWFVIHMSEKPWRDAEKLEHYYIDQAMSQSEMGDMWGVAASTICEWMSKKGVKSRDHKLPAGHPAQDGDTLRRMHINQGMSVNTMADELDVSRDTIKRNLKENGIERRYQVTPSKSPGSMYTNPDGYEIFCVSTPTQKKNLRMHLLKMCVEEDPHVVFHPDIVIHHKNEIPWDNRLENLQFMTKGSHARKHAIENDFGDVNVES